MRGKPLISHSCSQTETQALIIFFFWSRNVNLLAYSPHHSHFRFQAIILFNANEHEEAILRVQELAAACPNADTLACRVVEVSDIHSIKPSFAN
jgi:hypothetical protein